MLDRATLVRDVRERLFTPVAPQGAGAPHARPRIGAEVEMIAVDRATRRPLPLDGTPRSALALVRAAGARRGWIEMRSTKAGGPEIHLPDGGRLTFEPGGQLEYSSPPCASASCLLERLRAILAALGTEATHRDVELLFVGIDPCTPIEAVAPQLDAPRYRRMRHHFATIGSSGARMMRQTASFQVTLDALAEPVRTWRLLNALAPYVVAIFANSPHYAGRPTGHQSYRRYVWGTLDPHRTGLLAVAGDAAEEYVDFALAAGAFLLGDEGAARPFGEWLSSGAPLTLEDWHAHLTTLFPEVRPRGYFEVRSADMIPPRWHAAPLVLLGGILYAPAERAAAEALLGAPDPALLERAGRDGLHDAGIARVARELCALALDGGRALGEEFIRAADLAEARAFFEHYTLRGRAPADDPSTGERESLTCGTGDAAVLGAVPRLVPSPTILHRIMASTAFRDSLRSLAFLDGLTDSAFHQLARLVTPRTFSANEVLFAEGAPRQFMALLTTGAVAIEKQQNGRPIRLVTLGAGEAVGEGLLLDDSAHGTSARALQATEALVLTGPQIETMLKEFPTLYAALVSRAARAISRRLAATDATLVGRGRTLGFTGAGSRKEHDLLGERDVPDEALYGVQTLRALENFPITGVVLRDFPRLIEALAAVKEAAAQANTELGLLAPETADAIVRAAREIRTGRHHEHFLVDMIQGGAGTSTNMNANEVIANRALELLGHQRGEYAVVHPNNHVNLSQSTNDVYPTAIKLALHAAITDLREAMRELVDAFLAKGEEFGGILKMGRTQLQDAVPMTLGQEFSAFGHTILEDVDRLGEAQALIREINMGATAIGTGINAPPRYAEGVRRHLSAITGLELITAPDLVEATADTGAFVQLSGVLKRCAVKLSKICNDLRLLSSGPRAGLGEINLPPMQPGSSIMPGKVNPVIPEVVNQVCFDVIGGDMTVTIAAEAGQLQLNVFEPIIAFRLLRGIDSMRQACIVLRTKCVEGISPNRDRMKWFVENSIGIVTALVPLIGYEHATDIAKESLLSGRGVYDLVMERGLLTRDELDRALDPGKMAGEQA